MASSVTPRTVAVVLAGGTGTRVGHDLPKQLIKVAGRTILEHTLAALHACRRIDEIIVMMAPGHLDAVHAVLRTGDYPRVTRVLEGAGTRNDTTRAALAAIPDEEAYVLIHDAVRPFVTQRILEDNIDALARCSAVDTVIPSADTIVRVDGTGGTIADVLPRHELRRGQTPQSFHLSVLREAYRRADQDEGFVATDDCTVVLRYLPGTPIAVVEGSDQNMKVTEPIDVHLADKLFQLGSATAPGLASEELYREALVDRTMVVLGGSYGIGREVAKLADHYGARVMSFSRASTGTHVERRADIADVVRTVLAETGRIDFVVHAAGVLPRGPLVDASEEAVIHATEVNYLAPVFVAQEFWPHLATTRGSLLLFTSSSYTRGRAGYGLYSSAKAAIVNLTQALADEWAGSGVRVNCLNPERTATPMRAEAFGEEPPGTLLSAEQVAVQALDVLVSSHTGHVVDVRR